MDGVATTPTITVDIDGQEVQSHVVAGTRLWTCYCDYFRTRAHREPGPSGYCPHVAVAILQCIRACTVDPWDAAAGQFERFIAVAAHIEERGKARIS